RDGVERPGLARRAAREPAEPIHAHFGTDGGGEASREQVGVGRFGHGSDPKPAVRGRSCPIYTNSPHHERSSCKRDPYPLGVVTAPVSARTIAIIEDEASIAAAIAARLESEGCAVEIAPDRPTGIGFCESARPALVILDLMLRGIDGIEVCKTIQRERPVPVLMLTARDSETDLVVGLAVGADDYMTKPFSMREVVARVKALLRRAERPQVVSASVRIA